ncbi:MAG: hypothetical protein XU13_C0024G0011 [Candidatus Rokubacteria bacterium CSP1-6]|nr:MAG: hypothetical protein XU13_C0024G0011 [Candidatus Rokubacteria bacterium CSP1-6]
MRIAGTILIGWWIYVNTLVVAPYPYPYPVWRWLPRERFLHQEFCEFNAKRLRREGVEAVCVYVDD